MHTSPPPRQRQEKRLLQPFKNPLFTILVWPRWLDIGLSHFLIYHYRLSTLKNTLSISCHFGSAYTCILEACGRMINFMALPFKYTVKPH